ncbi:alpha/beta hydrolase family protein [Mucilaginibacter dorajii]|uniref:Peptidase S9 prolyl oligopeptidase catalytic domain-containing protein n=1 Tax=Mucilaginibacter dorajii TaxID=692994 RepID=A0ABP7Q4T6_9SPHI|nr:prolyl oligopeptidase family serine peptidase [Mucilaginibacter dorajii]MCS3732593.1 dipeptidyl aminopeptidase/acylaminoacyl peptidase [Mucilaginibacter dorajii]
MKLLWTVFLLNFSIVTLTWAQKKVIDKDACDNWPSLRDINLNSSILTNDGKYVAFQYGSKQKGSFIIVKSIVGSFKFEFNGTDNLCFTSDSRRLVALLPGDSLLVLDLLKQSKQYILNVKSFSTPHYGKAQFIAYQLNGDQQKFTVINLDSENEKSFYGVERQWINKEGNAIVIKNINGLIWLDIKTNIERAIPESFNTLNLAFDNSGNNIAFISSEQENVSLRYFNHGTEITKDLANNSKDGIQNGFCISDGQISFNKHDNKVFFQVKLSKKSSFSTLNNLIISKTINVWSYRDKVLQEKQLFELSEQYNQNYLAVVNINDGKTIQLEDENYFFIPDRMVKNYVLLTAKVSDDEFHWNKELKSLYVVNINDGKKTKIFESSYPSFQDAMISPDERFVVWFNRKSQQYYSYEISSGDIRNISSSITEPLGINQRGEADKLSNQGATYDMPVWLTKDHTLLVYDQNDIWQIDPNGKGKPTNVTNGYGNRNKIRFRVLGDYEAGLSKPDEILLWAFNSENKQNGFWKVKRRQHKDPIKLTMDSHAYYFSPTSLVTWRGADDPTNFIPIKAKEANVFVVRRMSANDAPNLYYTYDFKSFAPISDLHPQNRYNWLTAELVTWTLPDGLKSDGILFKPEDFDSKKKYPIIFNYYERRSEGLNVYRNPELSGDNINIPWYVSRGYLVFEPDMYYKTGKTAENIINVVNSAAKYLGCFTYIDTMRMGIQGQSFGGYETNVIATGTNIFAAACEMAGPTDIISEYGSLRPGGHNNEVSADIGQRNLGVLPWEYPAIFVENSPIFHIGKMTTPLLIVHNRNDGSILFSQAVELFMALRRSNKKAWMLEYDKEGHSIYNENNKLDFTIRMQQFFDHYLKGTLPPKWMTQGIAAKYKGIDSGLELDTSGQIP